MMSFVDVKKDVAFAADPRFRTLVEGGYIIEKGMLIVLSLEHAQFLAANFGKPPLYGWTHPFMGPSSIPVTPQPAAPQPQAASGMTTPPGGAGAPAAAPAAAQLLFSPAPKLIHGLTEELDRYCRINPAVLMDFDTQLSTFICKDVSVADIQVYLDASNGSGVQLLVALYAAADKMNIDVQHRFRDEFNAREQLGLLEVTSASFARLRHDLTAANNNMPRAMRHGEAALHVFYQTAIHRAGLHERVEFLELAYQLKNPGATIGREDEMRFMMSALDSFESNAVRLAGVSARALAAAGGGGAGSGGGGGGGGDKTNGRAWAVLATGTAAPSG